MDLQTFKDLLEVQRNSHSLPLVVSPLNPLRALMPPQYWKTISDADLPLPKVQWNFRRPLPSPALRLRFHSRKICDPVLERLSAVALFTGKVCLRCRICSHDSLFKRLLLFNHFVTRADVLFESALSLLPPDDDYQMDEASDDDCFPRGVLLKDRDDFDDDDRAMEEDPLIVDHPTETYPFHLF